MTLRFEHTFHARLEGAYAPVALRGFPDATTVAFNRPLAEELGLADQEQAIAAVVAGTDVPEPDRVLAMAYAGHQFGHLSPLLGDGRAALVGELVDPRGRRRDLHLKGSGRTPFSRGGDGRAALGPVLREMLVAEAMHHLGVPTSRVLAALSTGDEVQRETRLPGAVLGRVAASHLRVGTFELFALRRDGAMIERLVDYALERHFPEAGEESSEPPALRLLDAVMDAQATLVARWMHVGFVHGVMNTDNFTVSGETLDYGPCAFMDTYDPATVFSSIDRGGRYAFGNQPGIAAWNLARFAETLLLHIAPAPEDALAIATERIEGFQATLDARWRAGMRRKIGLPDSAEDAEADALVVRLLDLMQDASLDFTGTFRTLADVLRGGSAPEPLSAWVEDWKNTLRDTTTATAEAMDRINPLYIPRNHKVEEALAAAHEGDYRPYETLLEAVRQPFASQNLDASYRAPAPASFGPYQTFCGT